MTRQTYTAHGIPDLLDLVPALFGFEPRESFIAIATHGEHARFGFRLRLDIPPAAYAAAAANRMVGHLRRQSPDGVILLALTERSREGDALIAEVTKRLGPIPVHEAVRSDGVSFWAYGPDGPGEPMPYEPRCSPVIAEAVLEGMPILPDRGALVDRFAAVTGERKRVMEEVTARVFAEALPEMTAGPRIHLGTIGLARLGPIMQRHSEGGALDDVARATLAIWVSSQAVRDAVWSTFTRDSAETALRLWTDVSQHVVEPYEVPVLCLAGFAAWLAGDGAQALIATERALVIEPTYEMGTLILQLLDEGVSPAAWDGFEPEPPAIAA